MIYIPELIGDTIDRMRAFGDYSTVSKSGKVYTITATNTLRENEWLVLLTNPTTAFPYTFPITFTEELDALLEASNVIGQYQAKNVTAHSFQVTSEINIPEYGSWKSIEPYYLFGHRMEINQRLLAKDKDSVYKFQKYPLIALKLPIVETVEEYVHDVSLNLAILWYTDKNYTAKQRYDNIIHPKLMPLYYDFMEAIQEGIMMGLGRPEHQKVDRLFWGITENEGNAKYIFNDPLDAIEIIDLKLKILDSQCN